MEPLNASGLLWWQTLTTGIQRVPSTHFYYSYPFFFKVVFVYQSIHLHLCRVPKIQLGLEITAVFTKGVWSCFCTAVYNGAGTYTESTVTTETEGERGRKLQEIDVMGVFYSHIWGLGATGHWSTASYRGVLIRINKKLEKSELKDQKGWLCRCSHTAIVPPHSGHQWRTSVEIRAAWSLFWFWSHKREKWCCHAHAKIKGKTKNVQSHLSEKADDDNLVSQPGVINAMHKCRASFPRRLAVLQKLLKMNASNERPKVRPAHAACRCHSPYQ